MGSIDDSANRVTALADWLQEETEQLNKNPNAQTMNQIAEIYNYLAIEMQEAAQMAKFTAKMMEHQDTKNKGENQ